jgi:unsaturated rhamnogalacturonyl hydrolase
MKKLFVRSIGFFAGIFLAIGFQLHAQDLITDLITTNNSPIITPQSILTVMQRVADWQLANPSRHPRTDWTQGAGNAGMMALAGISGDAKYRDAMLAMGETNQWQLGQKLYDADDHCVGQAYAELYLLYRDNKMVAPLREKFDAILAKPPEITNLNFSRQNPRARENWSWCDSLFMGPPTWMRAYAATGDEKYLDFAVTNWWRTTDFLYDPNEHLFFRDSTYFDKKEANGQKVFWGRGNGWVIAGLVRTLQFLPMNHPDRPRFEKLFKDMAEKILTCQQPDGLWRSSLLDPESYPLKETSGSGFFTYALAWGVNQGLLDRATFEPAVRKGWAALVDCVDADGKLTHVQPVGADPKKFTEDSTEVYGVGAFLLAGSEVYRMAIIPNYDDDSVSMPGAPVAFAKICRFIWHTKIKISNPASFRRDYETVEIDLSQLITNRYTWGLGNPDFSADVSNYLLSYKFVMMDGLSSRILDSQIYSESGSTNSAPDKLLFQVDLAPGETKTFYILDASALAAVPPPIVKTFARYVPERHDDFAWESDRIAHRMYGPALETWPAEPLTSSGIDVWVKRTRALVINQMYGTMKLFDTNGLAQDDFKVGKTRGDGGLGIWQDGKFYVSKNWHTWKIITTGPIRSEFELAYDAWDVDGRKISETKHISIDAGSNMSRVESIFDEQILGNLSNPPIDKRPLQIGVGLAERPGENVIVPDSALDVDGAAPNVDSWQNSTARGVVMQNQNEGWMTYWQPQDFAKGTIGTALILPKGSIETFTNDNPNLPADKFAAPTRTMGEGQPALRNILAIAPAEIGKPFVYYFGAGWSESGDFPDAKSWNDYIRRFAERRDQPLQVTVGN